MISPRRRASSIGFDRVAARYDATRGGLGRGRQAAEDIGPHLADATLILEPGVGTGLVAAGLAEQGRVVLGVDISRPMLAQAAERIPGRVAAGDAGRLPVRDGSVDAVVLVHVLHLVADVAAVMAESARVVRTGGPVVASTVLRPGDYPRDAITDIVLPIMERYRPATDATEFIAEQAVAAGLDEINVHPATDEIQRQTPNEIAEAIETRLWAWTWDVPAAEWESAIVPAVAALRALPTPDAHRERTIRRQLLVARRSGSG